MLAGVVCVAFALRLGAGLLRGPAFVEEGYGFYAEIARTFLDGHGLCVAPGVDCAVRVPLYPLIVAPFLAADIAYPWLIVLQALLGALLPLVAFGLGRALFDSRVGMWTAVAAALNPYAIVHDPSFQDTVLFNMLIALSVLLLIIAVRRDRPAWFFSAGVVLALAMLTTARMIVFAPVALAWVAFASRGNLSRRALQTSMVALPLIILVGGWMLRNAAVVGTPVVTTGTGMNLWLANHELTMVYLPSRSIDAVDEAAWSALPDDQRRHVEGLAPDHGAQSRYLGELAKTAILNHLGRTLAAAAQKVFFSFSGWLSPARGWPVQTAFLLVFAPLNVLAAIGLWRSRRAAGHSLVVLLVASFALTTAAFWAHTSHGSFLHVLLIPYAARAFTTIP